MNPSLELLLRVEKIIGSKPISWNSINKGYTQAERYVMRFENGTSAFVKVSTEPLTIKWLRDEYKIYSSIKAEFIPQMLGWEDGEYPILILEDLSTGHWPPPWNSDQVQKVLDVIKRVADLRVDIELPSLKRFEAELQGWKKIKEDPSAFLGLGLVTPQWLDGALPKLIEAESKANLNGDSILHTDIRSDNICFLNDKIYLVDWNWTVRGNVMFDILAWLPSLHAEGGPTPWSFGFNEPELISALAGFHAFSAYQPPNFKGAEAIRALQLKLLKVYIPWVVKVLNLSEPDIS